MTTQNLALFQAIGAKMDYLNQRQGVISQNIANADTPGYRPKDIVDADFESVLREVVKDKTSVRSVHIEGTDNEHLGTAMSTEDGRERKQKHTYEVAPAGNAVIMEEQLINSGETVMDYNLMVNLLQKNSGMIKTAIGRGQ